MISLILQHLDNLQSDLIAVDPQHQTDAADQVAAMAAALRDIAMDRSMMDRSTMDRSAFQAMEEPLQFARAAGGNL
jgi:hypothetical protein